LEPASFFSSGTYNLLNSQNPVLLDIQVNRSGITIWMYHIKH